MQVAGAKKTQSYQIEVYQYYVQNQYVVKRDAEKYYAESEWRIGSKNIKLIWHEGAYEIRMSGDERAQVGRMRSM